MTGDEPRPSCVQTRPADVPCAPSGRTPPNPTWAMIREGRPSPAFSAATPVTSRSNGITVPTVTKPRSSFTPSAGPSLTKGSNNSAFGQMPRSFSD